MLPTQNGDKLIDIDSPPASFASQLHFQEFPTNDLSNAAKLDVHNSHIFNYNQTPGSSTSATSYTETPNKPTHSIWSVEYYQKLFNVDTDQVLERLLWALIPKPGVNYLQQYIQSKPDLYGPFWICVTLVFTIAISGNLASYLQNAANGHVWKYNFHHVTLAGTAIFCYAWILPTCLWGFLKFRGSEQEGSFTLLELLCVYGYSLTIYIPISVLWVIQISWLQWVLVIIGAAMSGYVLITSLWPAVSQQQTFVLIAVILGCHIMLAVSFMLYYFHNSPHAPPPALHPSVLTSTVPTIHSATLQ